ncbi:hypothetical protein OHPBIL_OHPBIL_05810, partial [Dysosmobacter welbionis]
RPAGSLPLVDGVFQPQPQQLLKELFLGAAVEGFKQPFYGLCSVILPHGADDAVPIQVCTAILVVCLEVWLKGVIRSGVPDQVPGPPLLTVQDLHQSNTSSRRSVSGRRVRITSRTSCRSKSSKDLLTRPRSSARLPSSPVRISRTAASRPRRSRG